MIIYNSFTHSLSLWGDGTQHVVRCVYGCVFLKFVTTVIPSPKTSFYEPLRVALVLFSHCACVVTYMANWLEETWHVHVDNGRGLGSKFVRRHVHLYTSPSSSFHEAQLCSALYLVQYRCCILYNRSKAIYKMYIREYIKLRVVIGVDHGRVASLLLD